MSLFWDNSFNKKEEKGFVFTLDSNSLFKEKKCMYPFGSTILAEKL